MDVSLVQLDGLKLHSTAGGERSEGPRYSDFVVRNLCGDLTGPQNRAVVTLGFDPYG